VGEIEDRDTTLDDLCEVIKLPLSVIADRQEYDPAYRLWCAVLLRAFDDLLDPCNTCSAAWWFSGKNTGLDEVCAIVGCSSKRARAIAMVIVGRQFDFNGRRNVR